MESACWKCNASSHLSSCEGSHVKVLCERLLRVTEELPALGMGGVLGACYPPMGSERILLSLDEQKTEKS